MRRELAEAMFFHPNRSIKRVVTIASPHRGSNFSNDATRWLGRKLIQLPEAVVSATESLVKNNEDILKTDALRKMQTSIDTLSPDSPILPLMLDAPKAPWTTYHNIAGILSEDRMLSRVAGESDGIVTFESAHLDEAESEISVDSDHSNVHRHPRAILEVQRILLKHLSDLREAHQQRVANPELSRLPRY